MGYTQNPLNVLKGQMTNKAVGLAHGNSMAMQVDPKDGVVVTGKDKSKSADQARKERLAKRAEEMARKKEKRAIEMANKKEERKFKLEEKKAAQAAELQRKQQALKKRRGQISQDAEDTSTSYSMALQVDPKDGAKKTPQNSTTMDFNIGTGLVEGKGGRRKQFEKAFATARKAGVKEFTYNVGEEPKKKYTTKLKGE